MAGTTPGAALVPVLELGSYDALADDAHALYVHGFAARAVEAARESLALTVAAGDVITSRYLRYIAAIAFQDQGRHHDAVAEATRPVEELGTASEPVWRAKALSVIAESSTRLGEHGRAIAAMAEPDCSGRMPGWTCGARSPSRHSCAAGPSGRDGSRPSGTRTCSASSPSGPTGWAAPSCRTR
jgi:hypothetical protein